jgi:hypothetical protein
LKELAKQLLAKGMTDHKINGRAINQVTGKLKKLTFPKVLKRKKRQVRQKRPVFSRQKTSFGAGEKFKFISN